jgi:endonuclease/exonuclease/phosphatase family metal-dependent hydrolase
VALGALTWNLFHGRDNPPGPALHSWRSRLLARSEGTATHSQVNRELLSEFATVLRAADWEVALLQECPPRWAEELTIRCSAEAHLVPTSRNLPGLLGKAQAAFARTNPDLIASWEGGANLTLARGRIRIVDRTSVTLTRKPETRRMALTRLDNDLCIANLHASVTRAKAEAEVLEAARDAVVWARGRPLILGGDLNLRPGSSPSLFARLEDELGLTGATDDRAIDHLLSRGIVDRTSSRVWAPTEREVADEHDPKRRAIRLSDHSPVQAEFELPARSG